MSDLKKITVRVPASLLAKARNATDAGITETVVRGLECLTVGEAMDRLRRLRGKIRLDLDFPAMRRDAD